MEASLRDGVASISIDRILENLADVIKLDRKAVVTLSAAAFVWAALRAFRRVSVKSLLRGLPGPSNPSWFSGAYSLSSPLQVRAVLIPFLTSR